MPAIKVLVAEDDPLHASKIEMLLDQMGYEVIGPFATETDILRMFRAAQPDLVVLDIQLKGGGDGVDIAARIRDIKVTPTIFTTSFEDTETIKRALATDPYAYIVKPVEKPSLQAAIELALYKFSKQTKDSEPIVEGYTGWSDDLVLTDSFFIKAGAQLRKVSFDDILWIEVAQDRYCDIVTVDRRYPVRISMNLLQEKLNPKTFVRIHRAHIVNIHKVDGIDDIDMVVEVNDRLLPLGGSYKSDLFNRFRTL